MFNIYMLITLIFFLFFISVGVLIKELDIPYVLASLIVSLLWLPLLIIYLFRR